MWTFAEQKTGTKSSAALSLAGPSPVFRALRCLLSSSHVHIQRWVFGVEILSVVLLKWLVGMGSYSGFRSPPLFGDFEAQRHWMALTQQVPLQNWYFYDLEYWGMDYPPLTAYHSFLLGLIAKSVDPAFVLLRPPGARHLAATGWEELHEPLKVLMRSLVIGTELLIWIPIVSAYHFVLLRISPLVPKTPRSQTVPSGTLLHVLHSIAVFLLNPNIILIDNGHFQFNSVMLGLALASVTCFHCNRDLLGAMFFVLSLTFKQMALYYSPAIFAYLFGKCIYLGPRQGIKLLVLLAMVTTLTTLAVFSPFIFLSPFPITILQTLHRIFPLGRGLFEDKVANFWCTMNVLIKFRDMVASEGLAKISLLTTLLSVMPGMAIMLWLSYQLKTEKDVDTPVVLPKDPHVSTPDPRLATSNSQSPPKSIQLLPIALLNSSLAFFLFSFQVHEKSILLAILPALMINSRANFLHRPRRAPHLLWCDEQGYQPQLLGGSLDWEVTCLVSNVALFSMWPLLRKDGLSVQYVTLMLLYNHLIGYNPLQSLLKPRGNSSSSDSGVALASVFSMIVYVAMVSIHVLELTANPPERLPDLYVVLNQSLSFAVFGLTYLWSLCRCVEQSWALIGFRAQQARNEDLSHKPVDSEVREKILQCPLDINDKQGQEKTVTPISASSEPSKGAEIINSSGSLKAIQHGDVDEENLKTISKTSRIRGGDQLEITQLASSQRIRISSPNGEKLLNRIKHRINYSNNDLAPPWAGGQSHSRSQSRNRLLQPELAPVHQTLPSQPQDIGPGNTEVELAFRLRNAAENGHEVVEGEYLERSYDVDEKESEQGDEGEEAHVDDVHHSVEKTSLLAKVYDEHQDQENTWEVTVRNSREEAIRRRRQELRLSSSASIPVSQPPYAPRLVRSRS